MKRRELSISTAKQIHLLGAVLKHRDGKPMVAQIGDSIGMSKSQVSQLLSKGPLTDEETPTDEEILEARNLLWRETQARSFGTLLNGWQAVADRWDERASDPDYDARDLRHTAHALDIGTKVMQLLTGGVTSRSQQEQTVTKSVTVKVIQIPDKDRSAFRTAKGLKEIAPVSAEIEGPAE